MKKPSSSGKRRSRSARTTPTPTPKPATAPPAVDEMRPEYDFSQGVRGKYAARFAEGTNLVLLDPDVAAAFPDAASVNRTLRTLLDLVPGGPHTPPDRKRTA